MRPPTPEPGTHILTREMRACWLDPGLLAREAAWRWAYGIPALLLVTETCWRIYQQTKPALMAAGLLRFSLATTFQDAYILAGMMQVLKPVVTETLWWLLPVLGMGWALAFGFGRTAVLHRCAPQLPRKPWSLAVMQVLRLLALAVMFTLWWRSIQWAASYTSDGGHTTHLTNYFGWVLLFSGAALALWAWLSWIFYTAPLLLLLEQQSFVSSLWRCMDFTAWGMPLAQANLILSLTRIGMAGLSTLLSAIPVLLGLAGIGLYVWWTVLTVLYLVFSAFLNVVRQAIFLDLWKSTRHT